MWAFLILPPSGFSMFFGQPGGIGQILWTAAAWHVASHWQAAKESSEQFYDMPGRLFWTTSLGQVFCFFGGKGWHFTAQLNTSWWLVSTHLKNMLVKMGSSSSSPIFGMKIPKIFELPAQFFTCQGVFWVLCLPVVFGVHWYPVSVVDTGKAFNLERGMYHIQPRDQGKNLLYLDLPFVCKICAFSPTKTYQKAEFLHIWKIQV